MLALLPESEKPADALSEEDVQTKSVGVTALAAAILRENGFVDDVIDTFGGNKNVAQQVLNIALGAAITAKPTYLSSDESEVQMFFGNDKCPGSLRAGELHKKIGSGLDLSLRISERRIARLTHRALPALDGTRINSSSDNILDSIVGKAKNGLFVPQINHSLPADAAKGRRLRTAVTPAPPMTFPLWKASRVSGTPAAFARRIRCLSLTADAANRRVW